MTAEILLATGDLVRVEIDRDLLYIADALTEGGIAASAEAEDSLVPMPVSSSVDDDFSAGALVVDFMVAAVSGVVSGVLASMITSRLADASVTGEEITLEELPVAEGDAVRLRFKLVKKRVGGK